MSNIIKTFINIVNNHTIDIANITEGNNRANNMEDMQSLGIVTEENNLTKVAS